MKMQMLAGLLSCELQELNIDWNTKWYSEQYRDNNNDNVSHDLLVAWYKSKIR